MNWGLKIVIGLGIFMLFILSAGIYMVSKDTDSLEDENYYEKSLHYDEVYQRKQHVSDNHVRPKVKLSGDTLTITFVQPHNQGELNLRRPSDQRKDVVLPFVTEGEGRIYQLPIAGFLKGKWQLEINWTQGEVAYTSLHPLFL